MRILHTSDWHLGRTFSEHPLLDDQRELGPWLARVVRELGVDVVVVAGDLYDRAVPSADAVSALDEILVAVRRAGAVIVAVAGNHDSAERVAFGGRAMAAGGVVLRGGLAALGEAVELHDEHGPVRFHPVPYLHPFLAGGPLGLASGARSHDQVVQAALHAVRADVEAHPGTRSVVVAHAFVAGGLPTDSEAVLVGGTEHVDLARFRGFDYVALGHLHRPQVLGSDRVAYSGSPLPYSFSEGHEKSVRVVDLGPRGIERVQLIRVPFGRPAVTLEGRLDELLTSPELEDHKGSFVRALLTDPAMSPRAMDRLRDRFPYAAQLAWTSLASRPGPSRAHATTDPADLLDEFLRQALGDLLVPAHRDEALAALDEARGTGRR